MKRGLYVVAVALAAELGLAGCGTSGATGPGGAKSANEANPRSGQAMPDQQHAAPPVHLTARERAGFDKAVDEWSRAKSAGPVSATTCQSLVDDFERAADQTPKIAAPAHFNAGTVLESCGQAKAAEAQYQAALAANSNYGPAISNLGELYYKRGDVATARQYFERAIAADPTHTSAAYTNLAAILFQQARSGDPSGYDLAIRNLRRALAIDVDSMPAYNLLALVYYTKAANDRSKLDLAALICKQAREQNDKYAPIYNTLGLIELRKKDVTGALKDFVKAVQLDPNYIEAHLNIGAIGLSSRQYANAAQSFQTVLRLQPNNVDATIGMGVALRGQKQFDGAEKFYKKAAELDPKNCAVPYDLGLLYQDYKIDATNQNLNVAKQYYNQFLGCGQAPSAKRQDAERRLKDIADTFVALEQQKEMQQQQQQMEKQQQEQMKQQQQQQKPHAAAGTKG